MFLFAHSFGKVLDMPLKGLPGFATGKTSEHDGVRALKLHVDSAAFRPHYHKRKNDPCDLWQGCALIKTASISDVTSTQYFFE